MPFKTRKHKTAAVDRRITFSENAIKYRSISDAITAAKKNNVSKTNEISTHDDYFYVRGDLIKIIIISGFIIGVQVTLALLKFPHA